MSAEDNKKKILAGTADLKPRAEAMRDAIFTGRLTPGQRLTENGFWANGREYEADCIMFASGFEVTSSLERRWGMEKVEGRGGVSIYDHWRHGPLTLHGTMTHGFPNQFYIGYIQGGLNASVTEQFGKQAEHSAWIITQALKRGKTVVEPTAEGMDEYVRKFRAKFSGYKTRWDEMENAAKAAILDGTATKVCGGRMAFGRVRYAGIEYLVMKLPGGRRMYYPHPTVKRVFRKYDEEENRPEDEGQKTHERKERLQRQLMSLDSKKKAQDKKDRERRILEDHRREEKELVKQGKKPFYLKKSEQKKRLLTEQFQSMKKRQVDKSIERRRKKLASREKRELEHLERRA